MSSQSSPVDKDSIPLEDLNKLIDNTKPDAKKRPRDFDDVLEIVGSTSTYQRFILYGILLPLSIFEALFSINLWFLMDEPNHWCNVPNNGSKPENLDSWKNLTIPREENGDFSKCKMFDSNHSIISCTNGWEYDFETVNYQSIVTDYDWVCDKSQQATWVYTGTNIGRAVSTFILGYLADKVGRKPVFIITLLLFSVGRAVSLFFAHDVWIFVLLAVISGMAAPMFAISCNTIALELSGKDFRAWIYAATWMAVAIGLAVVPSLVYVTGNWFVLGWTTILIGSLSYLLLPWMPESPRWLLSVGKIEEVQKILKNIAKWNGTTDKINDDEMFEMLREAEASQKEQRMKEGTGVLKLFSTRRLAVRTLIITLAWVLSGLVSHGIQLNSLNLHGHRFLNFSLIVLMELPGGFFGGILIDKFGRRWMQVTFYFVCFISCTVAAYFSAIGSSDDIVSTLVVIICANVAKLAITMSFLATYLQAMELFPTPFRTTGSGFASTISSFTIILVPYIVFTGKSSMTTPWIVSAIISFAGMVCTSFMPETVNHNLPETLEEAENFGKGRKFWSFQLTGPNKSPKKNEN
ncbi:unnamed protein product [Orchesella dallaii]|uniref:Major facilitator superfamily (MFS) profile domain-containing protein n=1 Tax=Orchesella dallaii TaxID=48710 RepID=A0ABP1PUZ5_9HEXA